MDLPTPDDTSRAEDHPDVSRESGPSFCDLGCLSNLAVLIGVFLYGFLIGCLRFGFGGVAGGGGGVGRGDSPMGIQGGLNAAETLLMGFFLLPILPIVVWIVGAAAYKAYKNRPFMNEGPKTLAVFLILAATALLVTIYRFFATGGAGSISGGMSVVDNLELLILAALVILYPVSLVYQLGGLEHLLRVVLLVILYPDSLVYQWYKVAADMADEEGNNADPAGKRKFFLDEDE